MYNQDSFVFMREDLVSCGEKDASVGTVLTTSMFSVINNSHHFDKLLQVLNRYAYISKEMTRWLNACMCIC